jgi:carboxypeptidase C (cathepsin A)
MLYIEQPAGVGFSYCDDMNMTNPECSFNDDNVAEDNLKTILAWFERYDEYKNHDLYIAGESYGGIYVPYLVNAIHHHNQKYIRNPDVFRPNLKGMMVGNGVTNWAYDTNPAFIDMAYGHHMIPETLYNKLKTKGCTFGEFDDQNVNLDPECKFGSDLYWEWSNLTDQVNVYDIFGTCYGAKNDSSSKWYSGNDYGLKMKNGKIQPYRKAFTQADYTPWLYKNKNLKTPSAAPVVPPCTFA